MFRDRTVSLVIPAYNEEETIRQVVEEFRKEPHLDEIVEQVVAALASGNVVVATSRQLVTGATAPA